MGVYFEPRHRGMGVGDYIGSAIMMLLGNGLQRSQNAQQYELGQRAENEAMAREQAGIDMRGERVRGLTFDPSNPSGMTNDVLTYAAQNPEIAQHLSGILGQTAPQNSPISVNLGNRMGVGAFNPRGGVEDMQFHDIGADPTQAYQSDNALKGVLGAAGINAGAQRDVANINAGATKYGYDKRFAPQPQFLTGADGGIYSATPGVEGNVPTGILGPSPQQPQTGVNPKVLETIFGMSGTDPLGRAIAGMEWLAPAQQQLMRQLLGGGQQSSAAPPAHQFPGITQDTPALAGSENMTYGPEVEQGIAQMMQRTGGNREQVIAYLIQNGVI